MRQLRVYRKRIIERTVLMKQAVGLAAELSIDGHDALGFDLIGRVSSLLTGKSVVGR
jgi:hypothetical protein